MKLGSFDRSSLKSEGRKFSKKLVRPPSCERALKIQRIRTGLIAQSIVLLATEILQYYAPFLKNPTNGRPSSCVGFAFPEILFGQKTIFLGPSKIHYVFNYQPSLKAV